MKPLDNKFWLFLVLSLASGLFIGWVDSRPNWDDTGITVLLILVATFIIGFFAENTVWVFALIVGLCVLDFNVILHNNYGSALSFVFAFIGAYSGVIFKKIINPNN
ncbi:MAG TPA: hypothetical protein VIL99_11885 [Ignavibacteria bacterium]|jgi:hypothetical protein